MPDPLLYLKAMTAAAALSALLVAALGWRRLRWQSLREALAGPLGVVLGSAGGLGIANLRMRLPPTNALDRLLLVILPVAVLIEVLARLPRMPNWLAWTLRGALILSAPSILLHRSGYVTSGAMAWSPPQTILILLVCAGFLATVWILLWRLSDLESDPSIALSLALAITTAGAAIMLAGYLKGGAAALVLASAIAGAAIAAVAFKLPGEGLVGLGVVVLFGLLFIGRYFGGLSTLSALTIFLSPLLGWGVETASLQKKPLWVRATLRLGLVAIPLVIVLVLAKLHFDQHMAPLL